MSATAKQHIEAEFPRKLQFLFKPKRYKVAYGGRGGAKSWGVARALLIMGMGKPLRVLCAREFQKSISESVHSLLADQIEKLGLTAFYEVQKTCIKGKNGTTFSYAGLHHNISNIKSMEAVDIVWVEEAQAVSKSSWATLIPTIRKDGSEIWLTFNPEFEEDETYKRFVLTPPTEAVVVKINWQDNPWFPDVLHKEMEYLKAMDFDSYLHVWEGHCRQMLEGAVYAKEMRKTTEEGRITRVPYDAAHPVYTYWDLGRGDCTSIWFVQFIGMDIRVVDFYQNKGHAIGHYLKVIQEKEYVYGMHYLPHDGKKKVLEHSLSIEEQVKKVGDVTVLPILGLEEGINAARTVFNRCLFDEVKTADGLHCLRRYRYDVDPDTGAYSTRPLHDQFSHAADAFRYLAVASSNPPRKNTINYDKLYNQKRRYK